MVKTITVQELKDKQKSVLLVDVREPIEYKTECIDGSCLIPLGEVSIEKLPAQDKTIVVHCRSGKRSCEAVKKLLEENPNLDIYSLEGGITAWKSSGFKVKTGQTKVMPLDRQTLLTIGFLSLTTLMLGVFVNTHFFILTGFVAIGQMFAGLSGWCGMAILLSKMPWNR